MARTVLGRDGEGRLVDIPVAGDKGMIGGGGSGGPHDHDGTYATAAHAHPAGDHPDLAAHTSLGLAASHNHDFADPAHTHDTSHNHDAAYAPIHAHDYAASGHTHNTTHNHDGTYADAVHAHAAPVLADQDIPSSIARDAEVTDAIATHAATPHGGSAGEAFPVGSAFIAFVSTNPAQLLGYGTWSARGAGRVLLGVDAGQSGGDTGGSGTHTHAGHTDHAALTHSGATVGNHAFTQPTAGNESAHTHTTAGVVQHTHVMTASNTAGTSGANAVRGSGSQATVTAPNPAGSVASPLPSSAGTAHTHTISGGGVDAHSVGQASQHAAQSHSAHDTASNLPPWLAVYIWERTA